jgi:reactive intermediate/imine deaminase
MREVISTDAAPAAVGAYSQATATEDFVFTAGQIPITPEGELLDDADVTVQAQRAIENVQAVLAAAGSSLADALTVTIYLADIEDFETVDAVYADFFDDDPPARSAVGVDALPKGVAIEIEALAPR